MTLRTPQLEEAYQHDKFIGAAKHLSYEDALKDWKYWKLVNNRYPYDRIVDGKHHMIVLKRDINVFTLTKEELNELWFTILPWADTRYDTSTLNFQATRSINSTPHIHLFDYKDEYK